MKTSTKILIGVGSLVFIYIIWELFWALKNNKADDENDETAASADDYDAYLKNIGASTDAGKSTGITNAGTISKIQTVNNIATAPVTWPIQLYQWITGGSSSSSSDNSSSSSSGSSSSTSASSSGTTQAKKFTYSTVANTASNFPVKWGSRNDAVGYIQRVYNAYAKKVGLCEIAEDCIYGKDTNDALAVLGYAMYKNGLSLSHITTYVMSADAEGRFTITQSQFKNWETAVHRLGLNI